MRALFPLIASIILILIFGIIQLLFFRFFNKEWWKKKWIKRAAWGLPLIGILSVLLWGMGEYYTKDWMAIPGALSAILIFTIEVCLILSLPVSGIIHFIRWGTDRLTHKREKPKVDRQRRMFLKSTAAAVPLFTLATGASGVMSALSDVKVYKKVLKIKNLPPELENFRILHLTDLHLRHYVTLDDLSNLLSKASEFSPDITLVTGDVADDLKLLPDALKLINSLTSAHGSFGCLGNHEYYRGIGQVLKIFGKSDTPLFINKGITIRHNDYPLFIGGLDDPKSMGAKNNTFFENAIDTTLLENRDNLFSIFMSHRPDALDYSSERDINLLLAGHTHGGQVGFNERSMFESNWPDRYLWGEYQLNNTTLYTSSGVGHWFPFRLGCPAEAPVIELKSV